MSAPPAAGIALERQGRVALVRLEHGKANAFDLELLTALTEQLRGLADDPATPAVVVTGRGSMFSAGVDLFRILGDEDGYAPRFLASLHDFVAALIDFPKPLVAAVNGHAIAGGCVLACACDRRLMAHGPGRIGVPELRVGVPFPSLPLEVMRLTLPGSVLRDLVLTGRTVTADEAPALGLVDRAVSAEELLERAVEEATSLAAIAPAAFAATKRRLWQPAWETWRREGATIDAEALAQWTGEPTRARIRAYLEATVGRSS